MAGVAVRAGLTTPRVYVIGLGSTGGRIVDELIERFEDAYDRGIDDIPWFNCLVLDTENESIEKPSCRLRKYHKLAVSAADIDNAKVNPNSLDSANDFSKWTVPSVINQWQPGPGAGNTRMLGRAILLHPTVLPEVVAKIKEGLSKLQSLPQVLMGPGDTQRHFEPSAQVDVFICGTLVGGTGSGGMIDLGYILHELPIGTDLNRIGVVSVPSSGLDTEHLKANAYQALTELAHFYFPGTKYRQKVPLADFPRGMVEPAVGTEPFDSVFLVQPRSGNVADQLALMVASSAQMIHSYTMTESSSIMRAKMINPATVYKGRLDKKARPQNFNGFGVAVIEYPVERIVRGCAAKLSHLALKEWLNRDDFDPTVATNWFVNRLSLTPHALVDALTTPTEGPSFANRVDNILSKAIGEARTHGSDVLVTAEQALAVGFDAGMKDLGQVKAGEFRELVQKREQEVVKLRVDKLVELVEDLISDGLKGPNWLRGSIGVWEKRLADETANLDLLIDPQILEEYKGQMDEQRNRLDQALSSGILTVTFWKAIAVNHILSDYEAAAEIYWRQRLEQIAGASIRKVYRSLSDFLAKARVRLDDPNFGLVQWVRQLEERLQNLYLASRDEPPNVNGYSYFTPGQGKTLDGEYVQILGKEPTPARNDLPPNLEPELYHRLAFLRDWSVVLPGNKRKSLLAHALTGTETSPFDPHIVGEAGEGKRVRDSEFLDVIRAVREPFRRELRTENICDRLSNSGKLGEVANALGVAAPFVAVNDIDTSGGQPAGGDIRIPNFCFIYGGDSLGDGSEQEVRRQIGNVNWSFVDSGVPYRILLIRTRAVFSGNAVSEVAAFEPFWKQLKDSHESRSRKDVMWRRLDGAEPIPQFALRMSTVLVALGMGVVSRDITFFVNAPATGPGMPPRRVDLDDSVDDMAIRLHSENLSEWLADEVRKAIDRVGLHSAATKLNEFCAKFNHRGGIPLEWHGHLMADDNPGARAGLKAANLMRKFVNTVPGLLDAWRELFTAPQTVGYEEVPATDPTGGGFICSYCGAYLGTLDQRTAVTALLNCPNRACEAPLTAF